MAIILILLPRPAGNLLYTTSLSLLQFHRQFFLLRSNDAIHAQDCARSWLLPFRKQDHRLSATILAVTRVPPRNQKRTFPFVMPFPCNAVNTLSYVDVDRCRFSLIEIKRQSLYSFHGSSSNCVSISSGSCNRLVWSSIWSLSQYTLEITCEYCIFYGIRTTNLQLHEAIPTLSIYFEFCRTENFSIDKFEKSRLL